MDYSFVLMEEQQKEISTTTNEGTTLMAHQSSRRDQYSKDKKHTKRAWKVEKMRKLQKYIPVVKSPSYVGGKP